MSNVDHNPNIFDEDEYGNLIPKSNDPLNDLENMDFKEMIEDLERNMFDVTTCIGCPGYDECKVKYGNKENTNGTNNQHRSMDI